MKPALEPASNCPKPCASPKNSPRILLVRRSLLAFVGRKQTVVRDQLFPQKPPGSRLRFSCTGAQHSPDSSTIELLSALAESGVYPSGRTLPGFPRVPPASRVPLPPEGQQIGARKRRAPGKHHPQSTIQPPRLNRPAESRRQPVGCISRGEPGPTPAGKTLPYSYPKTRFRRERARERVLPFQVSPRSSIFYPPLFPILTLVCTGDV